MEGKKWGSYQHPELAGEVSMIIGEELTDGSGEVE